ncbi:alpha/beta fold hydrolase [Cucumibacter marinus]|uniref:alpha/beta fold hydrolase n=1 Tax=Cucumibacter marinus TaxID=1121252 RepID=UPI0003FCC0E3|nr:alpha/beta hydrolase [Cucumibacter marinus]
MVNEHVIDGMKVVERPGSGPAVMFLHGIGSSANSFAPLFERLPAHWRLLAWNMPGYGGSVPFDQPWPLAEDYADRLHDLIRATGDGALHLVGHSLGALVGGTFASLYPEWVDHLVLMSCAIGHDTAPGGALSAGARERLEQLDNLGVREFARQRAPGLVHDPACNSCIVDQVRDVMGTIDPAGYRQATGMLSSGALIDRLAGLEVPTSIIVGENDMITPPKTNMAAHSLLPEAIRRDFIMIDDCGHAIYQQQPERCARILIDTFGGDRHD